MAVPAVGGHDGGVAPTGQRSQRKSDRRNQLLDAAERLIAERGFLAVRLEDIGAAAGVSGPAIYRHFPSKEALLVELLVGISTRLLAGAEALRDQGDDPDTTLAQLIDFHLDFVFSEPDLIRIQGRDLPHLPATALRQVRRAQRRYVEIWAAVLRDLDHTLTQADARLMAHAAFGLLNSTRHSMKSIGTKAGDARRARALMRSMTLAALHRPAGRRPRVR